MAEIRTPFEGFFFPPGFSVQPEEMVSLEGAGAHPVRSLSLRGDRIIELCQALRRERETTLVALPVDRIVAGVDRVARRLLDPADRLRAEALEAIVLFSGWSLPMAEEVLGGMAKGWTKEPLEALVRSEFPDPGVLDGFRRAREGGWVRALGYPLTFHLGAGTVPGVSTTSLIRTLLVKSAALLKPGLGDLPLPVLFARGLREEDPELGRSVAVLYWPAEGHWTETALGQADLVVAYGSDETVRWIRTRLHPETSFRAYRHRMGLGLVGRGGLVDGASASGVPDAEGIARAAALSVALFDQRGCVSPHFFFVERGGEVEPEDWAVLVADALGGLESALPSGRVSPGDGVAIQQLRGVAELGEGMGEGIVRHGGEGAPWTVVFLPGGSPRPSCLHRTITVLPVDNLEGALGELTDWAPYLQSVGVAGIGGDEARILERLALLGVSRICRLEEMPWPKPWWHHDGSGPLQDLVRWTDVEGGELLRSDSAEG